MRMNAIALTFLMMALSAPARERLEGLETVHGLLPNGHGSRLQTILTRPEGTKGRLPAVMLVNWLSCDGIELRDGPLDGMNELSRRIATRSGLVYFRVEKPGLGTSEGRPCADTDFQTELAGYRAGLAALRAHPWVDPERIVLVGMSNGAGILPLVSNGTPVAGYVVVNGWSRTWFEHMMEHLRRDAELRGTSAGEVSSRMGPYAELYAAYLIEKKTPGEIVRARPRLAKAWDDEPARQYGRPAAFFHQLQDLNLAEAWSRVAAPALVIWGEYDWIMGRDDHEQIAALINGNKPGAARLMVVPKMTHDVVVYDSVAKAMKEPRSGRFAEEVWAAVEAFLRETAR